MLYPKNQENTLSDELFRNPPSEYRDTPFWAWNTRLSHDKLKAQIDLMNQMGMGGFHMHVRTGMDSPYLNDEFMSYIRTCVDKADDEKMLAWLYDEDRWPSGSAGGKVTAGKPENARKTLLFTMDPYTPDRPYRATRPEPGRGQRPRRQDNGEFLAAYDVRLGPDGTLSSYHRIGPDQEASGAKWYAYMEFATEDPWFNNQPYVDTLNPDAIRDFLNITHETYYKALGEEFGRTIPAIFTDEPQFTPKMTLGFADEHKDVVLPWTRRLPGLYAERYGEDIMDYLPELIWELPEGLVSTVRYHYHDLVADMFMEAYTEQIGAWCREHHIALTGHLMGEETLQSQTRMVGDAMRSYPAFEIPGIDMLCDRHEYNTAKQTQSIVRQTGKCGMLSELYGVTGWDYDFRGYKLQGDWQAALGVTVRVPHLVWMTMKGEAKRDYPASIFYQSPWWDQYHQIADHFARVDTALTRGKAKVRVAVIHPVESYWLHWGPTEQTAAIRNQLEKRFEQIAQTLLFGKIDFDYICEARLPELCPVASNPLQVGEMAYDAVIVCGETLRGTTLSRLEAFRDAGGDLIFAGDLPQYLDAVASPEPARLAARSRHISSDPDALLSALEPYRLVDVRSMNGQRDTRLIYQLRRDEDGEWLFLANGHNPTCPDVDDAGRLRIIITGEYALTEYDTLSGEIRPLPARYQNGNTVLERDWHIHDSLLLKLVPGRLQGDSAEASVNGEADLVFGEVDVQLEEPNMLLLDMAEYAIDDGEWCSEEEILRIDNHAREWLGIPPRRKEVCQPYMLQDDHPTHKLRLRFTIPSEIRVNAPKLALEDPEHTQIRWNGVPVTAAPDGYFVDEDIHTIALPPIAAGNNLLEVTVPIGLRTNLEAFYLLGDFGVRVNGTVKTVTAPVRKLGFGDIVPQGLPFYTGNLCYRLHVRTRGGFAIRVPRYRGGLIEVQIDGKPAGHIIYSPYRLELPEAAPGEHEVTLRLFGTRYNGFAQLHHTQGLYFYQSPNSWRSSGDLWNYEYQFKPAGILRSPELYNACFVRPDGSTRIVRHSDEVHELT